jgi:glyoxylase-like metal-dependent hydrolase (beta-lactamase superfamily II)
LSRGVKAFRYNNTNFHLVESSLDKRLLAVDAGWPCSLPEYVKGVSSTGHHFNEIAWAMATHFHMDHAGLLGEFAARGVRCLVFENQEEAIHPMEKMILRTNKKYKPIAAGLLINVRTDRSREYFEGAGIRAEVIVTPGHSPDSVTFVTEGREAVIGDLCPPELIMPGDAAGFRSWELIRSKGARRIFPAHGPAFELKDG